MKKYIFPILLSAVIFSACEKEDPVIPNEEELITTLIYELVPQGSGTTVILKFQDLDGDGGDDPIYNTPSLAANTVYNGTVTLLNELEDPAENITDEVKEEAEEHQFFFESDALKTNVSYDDEDLNGNPVGIATILETGSATSGTLTITLKHEPAKPNDGTASGASGETDIEVTFNIDIKE